MSSTNRSREALRSTYWKTAGAMLNTLRHHHGWSESELAERAGITPELVTTYEEARVRYPELEAWWRMTTALGVNLITFLHLVEKQAGVRLLHDLKPQQASVLAPREQTSARPQAGASPEQDDLSAFIHRLDERGK